jgi:hypothetical protein
MPKVFNGRNKVFFFGDYEGLRRVQGTILTGSVPTDAERASGFTNFQDLITGQASSAARTDSLGRLIPVGTVLDPATTRAVTAGAVDPISGLPATATGFVRDPFGTCAPSTTSFTIAACGLNLIPAGRLDPNAIKLLNLYPTPTNGSLFSNFANSLHLFSIAIPSMLAWTSTSTTRISSSTASAWPTIRTYSGIFGGVADGGGFQQGTRPPMRSRAR